MDVLILSGRKAEEAVINALPNKEIAKRRYMVAYLGIIRSTNSIPLLTKIVADSSEPIYMRADALRSLYMVNSDVGMKISRSFAENADELGEFAGEGLKGRISPMPKRDFWDAFWCRDIEHL